MCKSELIERDVNLAKLNAFCLKKGCGSVVDKYVECDNMLIFLDLMLQKIPAYRHVLYNSGFQVSS